MRAACGLVDACRPGALSRSSRGYAVPADVSSHDPRQVEMHGQRCDRCAVTFPPSHATAYRSARRGSPPACRCEECISTRRGSARAASSPRFIGQQHTRAHDAAACLAPFPLVAELTARRAAAWAMSLEQASGDRSMSGAPVYPCGTRSRARTRLGWPQVAVLARPTRHHRLCAKPLILHEVISRSTLAHSALRAPGSGDSS